MYFVNVLTVGCTISKLYPSLVFVTVLSQCSSARLSYLKLDVELFAVLFKFVRIKNLNMLFEMKKSQYESIYWGKLNLLCSRELNIFIYYKTIKSVYLRYFDICFVHNIGGVYDRWWHDSLSMQYIDKESCHHFSETPRVSDICMTK